MADLDFTYDWNDEEPSEPEADEEFDVDNVKALLGDWVDPVKPIGMYAVKPKGFKNPKDPKRQLTEEDREALKKLASSRIHQWMNPNDIIKAMGTTNNTNDVLLLMSLIKSRVRMSNLDPRDHTVAIKLYLLQSPFWVFYMPRLPPINRYAFAIFLGRKETARKIFLMVDNEAEKNRFPVDVTRKSGQTSSKKTKIPEDNAPRQAGMPFGASMYDFRIAQLAFMEHDLVFLCLITTTHQLRFFITKNLKEWRSQFVQPMVDLMNIVYGVVPQPSIGLSLGKYPTIDAKKDLITKSLPSKNFQMQHITVGLQRIASGEHGGETLGHIKDLVTHDGTVLDYMEILRKFNAGIAHGVAKKQ
jgi:hypothetical protein